MATVETILNDYVTMRQQGVEARKALDTLRTSIDRLPDSERQELAQLLRHWERDGTNARTTPATSHDTPTFQRAIVTCTKCKNPNQHGAVLCSSCGALLEGSPITQDTQYLSETTGRLYNATIFHSDAVLVLKVRDNDKIYHVRPQSVSGELIIGRSAGMGSVSLAVDLTDAGGGELGVSRLHLALRYAREESTVQVYDLGSANGSYINGQKLHPREIRVLQSGDELRLGRMVLRVEFIQE